LLLDADLGAKAGSPGRARLPSDLEPGTGLAVGPRIVVAMVIAAHALEPRGAQKPGELNARTLQGEHAVLRRLAVQRVPVAHQVRPRGQAHFASRTETVVGAGRDRPDTESARDGARRLEDVARCAEVVADARGRSPHEEGVAHGAGHHAFLLRRDV